MSETHDEERRDQLAAYLLGALEQHEAAELERHLAGCEECREQMQWLRPAVQLLPESVERLDPSPQLRERILGEARAAAKRPSATPSRRRRPFLWRRPALAAAGLAAVALVAGYAIVSGGSGSGQTTIVAGTAPGVTAKVTMEGDSAASLQLAHVHQLPPDKVLEAWVRRGGRIVPVRSLFVPDREGRAATELPGMSGVDAVMVTAEPRGGSNVPTSNPMVTLTIPQ